MTDPHANLQRATAASRGDGGRPEHSEDIQIIDGVTAVIRSQALRALMQMLQRVARHNASVLVCGETGSGKEMVARAIHHFSLRCSYPFVDVNCAALPEHLVESELFGYEKGAFSGAEEMKPGLFEVADKGTLFLDEIGELDPKIQVKLLRVLDGVPYYRLGGHRKISVDVRIVAATNQKIEAAVQRGTFRSDLYHRLSQFELRVPPLRERPEDIAAIAQHILHHHFPESRLTPEALEALLAYSWPGNVRELKNVVFKAVVSARDGPHEIRVSDLPPEILRASPGTATEAVTGDLGDVEKQAILRMLAKTGGHRGQAAEQLGISRRTLVRKLKLYNVGANEVSGRGSFGALSQEQQRYFRVNLDIPVLLRAGHEEIKAASINVSSRGIAVRSAQPLRQRVGIAVAFHLPEAADPIHATAELAWTDTDGKTGLRFTEISSDSKHQLDRWIAEQLDKEGWTADGALLSLNGEPSVS